MPGYSRHVLPPRGRQHLRRHLVAVVGEADEVLVEIRMHLRGAGIYRFDQAAASLPQA